MQFPRLWRSLDFQSEFFALKSTVAVAPALSTCTHSRVNNKVAVLFGRKPYVVPAQAGELFGGRTEPFDSLSAVLHFGVKKV